jgi:hypothetical protein
VKKYRTALQQEDKKAALRTIEGDEALSTINKKLNEFISKGIYGKEKDHTLLEVYNQYVKQNSQHIFMDKEEEAKNFKYYDPRTSGALKRYTEAHKDTIKSSSKTARDMFKTEVQFAVIDYMQKHKEDEFTDGIINEYINYHNSKEFNDWDNTDYMIKTDAFNNLTAGYSNKQRNACIEKALDPKFRI